MRPAGLASEGHPVTARLIRRPGGPARLRALLDSGQIIVAPGAFDPLSARLVEEAGFPAVYMTGFGTSAALLGRPDVGLRGRIGLPQVREAEQRYAVKAAAPGLPVRADSP